MLVPGPWQCHATVTEPDLTRFRLAWRRERAAGEPDQLVSVVMYNPAREGEPVQGGVRDGATHRRVRALLNWATEIRVVNLSPVRTTKPVLARSYDLTVEYADQDQDEAIRWACEAPVVVVAWGAGARTPRMERCRRLVLDLAGERLHCWGLTGGGEPMHPSPLGRIPPGAPLVRYAPKG